MGRPRKTIDTGTPPRTFVIEPTQHFALVKSIAAHYWSQLLDMDDLIQEGMIGLLNACYNYNKQHGGAFSTYATRCIKRQIMKAIQNARYPIRIPLWMQRELHQGKTGRTKTRRRSFTAAAIIQRALSNGDIAIETQVLNRPQPDLDPKELFPDGIPPLQILSEQEYLIVCERYGLDGMSVKPPSQIGKSMGLSKQRIQQIDDTALDQLSAVLDLWHERQWGRANRHRLRRQRSAAKRLAKTTDV